MSSTTEPSERELPLEAVVSEKEKKKSKKRLLLLLPLSLLLIASYYLLQTFKNPQPAAPSPIISGDLFPGQGDAGDGRLPDMAPEDILAKMQEAADASKFSFIINSRPVFKDGKSTGNLNQ